MRLNHIFALATLVLLVGAVLTVFADGGEPIAEAAPLSELVPDLSTSSTIQEVSVLSESIPSIAPDQDLDGNPVEDHYVTTTTAATTTTTEPKKRTSKQRKGSSSPTTTTTTVAKEEEPEPPPPPPEAEGGYDSGAESAFAGSINDLRASNGLAALSRSGSLDSEARSWAKTIGQQGSLAHSNIGRLVPPWSAVAENVGSGGSVSSVFGALAGSGGHRSNMLGDYTHFGIGAWVDGSGRIWTVHLFAR